MKMNTRIIAKKQTAMKAATTWLHNPNQEINKLIQICSQIILLKQVMKLINEYGKRMSLLHRTEYKKVKCNRCGAFNKIEWNRSALVVIFSCDKCGEYQTI
jgi:hypothetical protein